MFVALRPSRLLFSHYGPVEAVDQVLDRSAEEITLSGSRRPGGPDYARLDLDHAVAMVHERESRPSSIAFPKSQGA